jgi:hypothetical protein
MTYLAFKVVHIFGVVVFLGNIIVTGVWRVLADRTGEPRSIAYAQHLVTLTDWVFTLGGVVLILIGAYGMVWTEASIRSGRSGSSPGRAYSSPQALFGCNPDSSSDRAGAHCARF